MDTGIKLRNGTTTSDPRLDRLIQFDEKSRNFRAVTPEIADRPRRSYSWNKYVWLDQGQEGACVEFAFAHEFAARPVVIPSEVCQGITANHLIYWPAQQRDPWEGGSYPGASPFYEGTSVLSGAQVGKELGYIDEYRWAFGEDDLALTVGYKGPVVLGVNWYSGMDEVDEEGFIYARGNVRGGHAILCAAYSVKLDAYRLDNSWGLTWGVNGSAWIAAEDMRRLLAEDGEALVVSKRGKGA